MPPWATLTWLVVAAAHVAAGVDVGVGGGVNAAGWMAPVESR